MVLVLDKDMVRGHLCNHNSSGVLLTMACSTGMVDTMLDWISPELLAKQVDWNAVNVVMSINKWTRGSGVQRAGDTIASLALSASRAQCFSISLRPQVSPLQLITFKVISLGRTAAAGHGNRQTPSPRSHLGRRHLKEIQLVRPLYRTGC